MIRDKRFYIFVFVLLVLKPRVIPGFLIFGNYAYFYGTYQKHELQQNFRNL